jgi:hypothetical protein
MTPETVVDEGECPAEGKADAYCERRQRAPSDEDGRRRWQ